MPELESYQGNQTWDQERLWSFTDSVFTYSDQVCWGVFDVSQFIRTCISSYLRCIRCSFFLLSYSLNWYYQAYTMELETEIAKLKEENEELQKKQVFLSQDDCVYSYYTRA